MRALLIALLVSLAATTASDAAVSQVARLNDDSSFAITGDRVLYTLSDKETGRVLSRPVSGGPARELFRFEARPGDEFPELRLSASAKRIGLVVATENDDRYFAGVRAYAGSPEGPLEPLGPEVRPKRRTDFFPVQAAIDGAKLVLSQVRDDLRRFVTTVISPDGRRQPIQLPRRTFLEELSGRRAVFARRGSLVVIDWRSGETLRVISGIEDFGLDGVDLSGNGTVAYGTDDGRIAVSPSRGRPRYLARGRFQSWDGRRLLFSRYRGSRERLMMRDPNGRFRAFGYPAASIETSVTDGRYVAWSADRCLVVARVRDRAVRRPARGNCPR